MSWSDAASIVAVVGAALVAFWQLRRVQTQFPSRRVRDGVSIVDAAGDLLKEYRVEVKLLRDDVAALRVEQDRDEERIEALEESLRLYRRGVDILIAQLRRLGMTPEWTPPHDEPDS